MIRKNFTLALICATICIIACANAVQTAFPASLKNFFDTWEESTTIPGLSSGWTPQGLAYYESKDWMLTSHYWGGSGKKTSKLGVVKRSSDTFVKMLSLKYRNPSGKVDSLTGHVGGIAVSKKYLWVASEESSINPYSLFRYKLSDVVSAKDGSSIVASKSYTLNHVASYATYYDGTLWVGTYTRGKDLCDPAPGKKGKVYGYKLNNKDSLSDTEPLPSSTWITPDRIQGMAMTKNRVIYAQSCGRTKDSTLFVYTKGKNGEEENKIVASTMAEGLTIIDDDLYVLFESGSKAYVKGGKMVLENVYKTDLSNIL